MRHSPKLRHPASSPAHVPAPDPAPAPPLAPFPAPAPELSLKCVHIYHLILFLLCQCFEEGFS